MVVNTAKFLVNISFLPQVWTAKIASVLLRLEFDHAIRIAWSILMCGGTFLSLTRTRTTLLRKLFNYSVSLRDSGGEADNASYGRLPLRHVVGARMYNRKLRDVAFSYTFRYQISCNNACRLF